jgi:alkylation response protein AidB-like acyl-CoA dehydrogenase
LNLDYSTDDLAFADEVRSFIQSELPPATRAKVRAGMTLEKIDVVDWVRTLHRKGWSTPAWPRKHGGPGWSLMRQMIFRDAVHELGAPEAPSFGVGMVGPVIYTFGTPEQQDRFLPRIANLDDWWCQGFSEPGAGSDLASLRTTARRNTSGWVLNGQKTWTTHAQHADWIFVLARTDPDAARKQQGISFFLVDMRTPGVVVRPIRTIDGGEEINEVFFDEVCVPPDQLVGKENEGWTYAKFLLGHERLGQARVGLIKSGLRAARQLLSAMPAGKIGVLRRASLEQRLLLLEVDLRSLELTRLRMLSEKADGAPQCDASILKIKASETLQAVTELNFDIAGQSGLTVNARETAIADPTAEMEDAIRAAAGPVYFNHRKVSIYGGTNEIQRNIVAQAVLGS